MGWIYSSNSKCMLSTHRGPISRVLTKLTSFILDSAISSPSPHKSCKGRPLINDHAMLLYRRKSEYSEKPAVVAALFQVTLQSDNCIMHRSQTKETCTSHGVLITHYALNIHTLTHVTIPSKARATGASI